MEEIAILKQDVREGRIDADQLVDLLVTLQRELQAAQQQLQAAQQQLQAAQQRNHELEKQLGSASSKLDEPFSLRSEEQRQAKRRQKKRAHQSKGRRGRVRTADQIAQAQRQEKVSPESVPPEPCALSHVRPVWRLEEGKAVLIAYEIDRGPKNQYGKIPGVLGRSEFGLEIVLTIAHLV